MLLSRTGNKAECLVYAESHRRKLAVDLYNTSTFGKDSTNAAPSGNQVGFNFAWNIDKIKHVVSQTNATVLYYSLLEESVLVWILQPGCGIVRFYQNKVHDLETNLNDLVMDYIAEIKGIDPKELLYKSENRALPLQGTALELVKKKNDVLSTEYELDDDSIESETMISSSEQTSTHMSSFKPAEKKLFNLLLAGVDDILSKSEADSPLVIVPDKALIHVPFTVIQDWNGKVLGERFRVTTVPSLFLLDQVAQNELNQLKIADDRNVERSQSRLGGVAKMVASADCPKSPAKELYPISEHGSATSINTKKTSNPRLAKSGALKPYNPDKIKLTSRESTFLSTKTVSSVKSFSRKSTVTSPPTTLPLKSLQPIGAPASIDKVLHSHTLSTVTTETSTHTDITKSSCGITPFKQISDQDKCVVFGNPLLPER